MSKFFDYAPRPYPQEQAVEEIIEKLSTPARLVSSVLIDRSDPAVISAASRALERFDWNK